MDKIVEISKSPAIELLNNAFKVGKEILDDSDEDKKPKKIMNYTELKKKVETSTFIKPKNVKKIKNMEVDKFVDNRVENYVPIAFNSLIDEKEREDKEKDNYIKKFSAMDVKKTIKSINKDKNKIANIDPQNIRIFKIYQSVQPKTNKLINCVSVKILEDEKLDIPRMINIYDDFKILPTEVFGVFDIETKRYDESAEKFKYDATIERVFDYRV
ncbi:MAG: hypothetical protein UR43_C0020G0004 [candidate division TM6 bacterium GW2011_GWF2_33_332]|nr:MAG: hypothetical protein UR43_C0020G0004 [candidate division TM6 bacterium GW2011_GWF2_33_332]